MGQVLPLRSSRDGHHAQSAGSTDAELVAGALAGRVGADEALFRRHYPAVLRLAHRLLGREDDADDLAQDVCVIALGSLDRLRDAETFGGWIRRICVLRARTRIRQYRLLRRLHLVPERTVDADQVVSRDAPPEVALELSRIYRHIQALPVDARTALILRRVQGLSIAEIASAMDRSPATVKRRIDEAQVLLARLVGRRDVADGSTP